MDRKPCLQASVSGAVLLALVAASSLATLAFAASQTHEVIIEDMQFHPAELEVEQGDTVTWINKDFVPHNATADDGAFRSDDLQLDQSWSYQADQKGDFSYYCSLHPTMKAELTVK